MRIVRFEAAGLNGKDETLGFDLHPDLNIITGRNGSGKTTILKLIWYLVSGNIQLAMREVAFSRLRLVTTDYEVVVHRIAPMDARIEFKSSELEAIFEDIPEDEDFVQTAEAQANGVVRRIGSSLFFPTFRRIEGGFTLSNPRKLGVNALSVSRASKAQGELEESLQTLSRRLSHGEHSFVCSLSTSDIVDLLMSKYTEISTDSNNLQSAVSQKIIEEIKAYRSMAASPLLNADELLDSTLAQIEEMDRAREEYLAPFTAVRELVQRLLQHNGIRLNAQLSFGDTAGAINSDALSAGEKQMLSFVCYNAFIKQSVVVIDEPELSLHVDWQRTLFPILQGQGTSNQFIIATHSPFIYSKFPDKEIMLSGDRGAEQLDEA